MLLLLDELELLLLFADAPDPVPPLPDDDAPPANICAMAMAW